MLKFLSKIIFITIFVLSMSIKTHGIVFQEKPFRLAYYVYYQILYKLMNVPLNEFENVTVINETVSLLTFEYGGEQYTATIVGKGAIFVDMPGDNYDRYLTREKAPVFILSQYQY